MNDASEKLLLDAVVGGLRRMEGFATTLEGIILTREETLRERDRQISRNQRLIDQLLREKHGAIAERPNFEALEDLPPNTASTDNGAARTRPEQSGGRDALVLAQRRRKQLKEKQGREAVAAEAARPRS